MMNQGAPNWNMESNLPLLETQKRSTGVNNELVELLWRNGQVVKNSQTHRKLAENGQKNKYDHALRDGESLMNVISLVEDDVTMPWMQSPLDDPLGGDFLSSLFFELPNSHPVEKEKAFKHFGVLEEATVLDANSAIRLQQPAFRQPNNSNLAETSTRLHIPSSSTQELNFGGLGRIENFPHFSRPSKAEIGSSNAPIRGSGLGLVAGRDIGESSVMTIGSSDCGSNHIPYKVDRSGVSSNKLGSAGIKKNGEKRLVQCERGLTETFETTITSSSGGSGGSYMEADKQFNSTKEHKRKGRDANESELQSEGAEFESAGATKAPRSGSTRRSRAAEVHNLSERRRRDRINEKMKALQELIPHCNKSDKASMLDEAIEYLKSLQLQVQMMWMGGGMTPMMFPGIQNYISRMTMGVGTHQALPSIHSPVQLPRVPLVNRSISSAPFPNQPTMCPSVLSGVNFQNRMQNPNFSLPYMGFHQMQTPQSMNMYGYGSQTSQQSSKIGPNNRTPTENTPRTK